MVLNVTAADALAGEPGRLVRFHALWNAACALGAIATGIVLRLGASWRVGVGGRRGVRDRRRAPDVPVAGSRAAAGRAPVDVPRARSGLRHEGLTVLAFVFAASAMVEGGVATWGVLYLRAEVGVGVLAGVGAYVVGNVLATIARVGEQLGRARARDAADGRARRVDHRGRDRARGAVPRAGHRGDRARGGFARDLGGVAAADRRRQQRGAAIPALAIGGVTAAGYLGMVAGPPIVGLVAGAFGRSAGLMVLAAVAVFVAVTPAHVRTPDPQGA